MVGIAWSFLLGVSIFQISRHLPPLYCFLLLPVTLLWVIKWPAVFLLLVMVAGYLWSYGFALYMIYPKLAGELVGKDIDLTGVVHTVKSQNPEYARLVLRVDRHSIARWHDNIPKKIMLGWYHPEQIVADNQRCDFVVRLKPYWRFANPGSFDIEKAMFLRAIGARGYIRSGRCMPPVAKPRLALRAYLMARFGLLSEQYEHADLMQALTFGDRENIDQHQWQVLRKTGTAHLLAISGLHISAISLFVFYVVRNLARCSARLCERLPAAFIAAVFALLAAAFYAYLAGFSLPTQRALIMVSVALLAVLLRRPVVSFSVYSLALLMVLLIQPMAVLSAGFWLSFLAVLCIYIILKSTRGKNKWLRIFWLQCYLGLALLGVSLLFFSQASLISPLVNVLAIPAVSFLILPLLLFTQLLFALHVDFSQWLFVCLDQLFDWLWQMLSLAAGVDFSSFGFSPGVLGVMAYQLGLFLIVQPRGTPARYLAWLFMAALFLIRPAPLTPAQMRFTVLDVGQGLSVFIETQNHALIYDAGVRFQSGFNTGEAVVLPFMKKHAIHQADLAVVSHNDNDHAGGMHALLRANASRRLIVSNQAEHYQTASVALCRAGQQWHWDGVLFRFLHPPAGWQSNDNNRSCVLQVIHPAGVILLPGDIEKSAENRLVDEYGDKLASHLIVAPHHGSRSSSSDRLVDYVSPQTVIFSAGYHNSHGFPHAMIRQRYEKAAARTVNTAYQGAVEFIFDAKTGITMQPGHRWKHKRYWHFAQEQFTHSAE